MTSTVLNVAKSQHNPECNKINVIGQCRLPILHRMIFRIVINSFALDHLQPPTVFFHFTKEIAEISKWVARFLSHSGNCVWGK